MEWTGNVARTIAHVVIVVGAVALALGIAGLLYGASFVKDASQGEQFDEDVGDLVEALVLGGAAFTVGGLALVVVGFILLGVARSLQRRMERRHAALHPA